MIQIKIGSAPGNNVVLNHPSVSPFHLEILRDDKGNFLLTDLNSLAGTTVNGYRIQGMVQLRETDIVKAGELVLPWTTYFLYQAPIATPGIYAQPGVYTTPGTMHHPAFPNTATPPAPEKPMNKKKLLLIVGGGVLGLLLIAATAIYLYIRPSTKHLKLIPSDAFVVMSVDLKSIAGKIDMEKMQQLEFFKDMKKQTRGDNDALSKAMSDPMSSGIDIFSQPYAFATVDNSDYPRYTGGIVFAIKSESKFRNFIARASDEETIKQGDKFSILRLNGGSCVAWNGNSGVMLFSDRSKNKSENYCRTLFELSEKESIVSVESFTKFKNTTFDIGFYVNYDAMRGIRGITIPPSAEGSASIVTIDFNEGKLSYTNQYLPGPGDPSGVTTFVGKKGINDALKATIPGKSYGIATMSLDINEIYKFMNDDPKMARVLDEVSGNLFLTRKRADGNFNRRFLFQSCGCKRYGFPENEL